MKKILISFSIGLFTGIISFYGYYTHKYVNVDKMIDYIINNEYNFFVAALKILIAVIFALLIIAVGYLLWVYVIKETHEEIKQEKEEIEQNKKELKEKEAKLKKEKQTLYRKMQEELQNEKEKLRAKENKRLIQLEEQLKSQYEQKLSNLEKWKKQESYEKERLKEKIKCLEEKIYHLQLKKAEKFRITNPGRYKKEVKKAQRLIEECKNPNRHF